MQLLRTDDDVAQAGGDHPSSSASSSRPRPRPSRSPQQRARIRTQNRRLEYLRRNPAYLESSDREFANVKLYDSLIRSFQTPAERTAEARDKGFGQVLEASILRNPEPLRKIDDDDIVEEEEHEEEEEGEGNEEKGVLHSSEMGAAPRTTSNGAGAEGAAAAADDDGQASDPDLDVDYSPDPPFAPDVDVGASLSPRDAARRRWQAYVRDWFVRGGARDDGFDYAAVDDDSDYDALARADAEDAWFDEESPGWASEEDGPRTRTGETGIQDF